MIIPSHDPPLFQGTNSDNVNITKEAEDCSKIVNSLHRPQEIGILNIKVLKAEGW